MGFEYYINKYRYYRSWYEDLTGKERRSVIGVWISNNCFIYSELIHEMEKAIRAKTV